MSSKYIYAFGGGKAEGSEALRDLLGGKGAGLAEMSRSGAPVPPGFTVTTEACLAFLKKPEAGLHGLFRSLKGFRGEFDLALRALEKRAGKRLGEPRAPLLVSVRSGSKFSMPGMMDTVLNLGLTAECAKGLERLTGDRRFALDSRRRFIQMFGNVVRGIDKERFEEILRDQVKASGAESDRQLESGDLEEVVARYLEAYRREAGEAFPEDARSQLEQAVSAVFRSWKNPRAVSYRRLNGISHELGTACTVQAMVFGNMGKGSGTGVGFTRDPGTGGKEFYGEYLPDAQGEDVVAGLRTPLPLKKLEEEQPKLYRRLKAITSKLEKHYRDAQDFEFTIERGALYMLQTRRAKRTPYASLKMAVDMAREGLISRDEALLRVSPDALDHLLKPVFDDKARKGHPVLAKGLPAGPGAVTGRVVLSAEEAVRRAAEGPVILVRPETNPDDIEGMSAALGILTATGGMTSHAAVVGRGMGKVCVVGCGAMRVHNGTVEFDAASLKPGDFVSLDGFTGEVLQGQVATRPPEVLEVLQGKRQARRSEAFRAYETFMGWADKARRLGVRANADRPEDARVARLLGAEGIGLCRTEHMFFGEDRIGKMLAMIVAEDEEERRKALAALYPLQRDDFKAILKAMQGLPVTIRTLDPPLHEFLPHSKDEARERGRAAGLDPEKLWRAAERLKELNPMLGHRGCRVGVTHPEVTEMQGRAILAAAGELKKEGADVRPEIMIPLVGFPSELEHQRAVVEKAAGKAKAVIGTMIEVPRAVFAAGEIARGADFFSFGTNDLTQMLLGYSRDDYGKFIAEYLKQGVVPADPFQTLDQEGVGAAVEMAVREARKAKPRLKIGVCGEHGGDPASVEFFHRAGLDYVSCSPYRVPVARLAAAQAAVRERLEGRTKAR